MGRSLLAVIAAIIVVAAAVFVAVSGGAGGRVTVTVTHTQTELATVVETKPVTVTATLTVTETNVETVTETLVETKTVVETQTLSVRKEFPRFLVDALGRNVTIPEPPKKLASLSPAITEMLWALGVLNKLVAVDHSSDYPPVVVTWKKEGRVVDVGGYWWTGISLEKLVSAEPDLVIAEVGAHAKLLAAFRDYGLRVVYVRGGSAKTLEDVYLDIWLVGYAVGAERNATRWIEAMKANVTLVEEKLAEANVTSVPVLVILWWSPQGIWVSGGDTFLADMVKRAGGYLVTSKYSGWQQLSLEQLAELRPQLILYTGMGGDVNSTLQVLETIASSEPVKSMLEEGAKLCGLYGSATSIVLRPGPRAAMGVQLLASVIHPEVFGEPSYGVVCLGGG
ncbi:periplasmic binding protein [Pyrolobus fumarii 1A]|uniref:Periplasmic binding protein n=1 Tax=Pyrolobus fumarii (strain DSM 11204 / 1A) TaxID=694429 RepID=G0ED11_PYRF1|nr:ABC transporter substrate-binding protein [Pyrolobus fumarii]AEM38570.1 periplasmic binding protein [Pyrolobus fumarii 1A]